MKITFEDFCNSIPKRGDMTLIFATRLYNLYSRIYDEANCKSTTGTVNWTVINRYNSTVSRHISRLITYGFVEIVESRHDYAVLNRRASALYIRAMEASASV